MSNFVHTYDQAIEFLLGRINYERVTGIAFSSDDQKLSRMRRLLEQTGNPHEGLKVIHIAGTKGKGSTSAMAASILTAAGQKTGLFTSPHVSAFEERMVVDGASPSPGHLVDLVNRLIEPIEHMDRAPEGPGPTYFELATAIAWLYFRDCAVDLAVLEVGLGGRLDATNVCEPHVSVITNISRDHTNVLGNSTAEIAREKAGIVKAGVPVISGVDSGPAGDVIEAVCLRHQSPLYRLGRELLWRPHRNDDSIADDPNDGTAGRGIDVDTPWGKWAGLRVPLLGHHQSDNAALAVAAATLLRQEGLRIPDAAVARGLSEVRWPARIEVLGTRPTIVVDAAHNWAATAALLRTIQHDFPGVSRKILIFAATRDKDVAGMLRQLLPGFDSVVLTQYHTNPRGVPINELAAMVQATAGYVCHVATDAAAAWSLASRLATNEDLICVTGSFFVAAELRKLILDGSERQTLDRSQQSATVYSEQPSHAPL
ncbi:MAG TPA: folylpolyglutamate synthase/dihydrofolate synthase family protein [Planctomycetaceae bacterium]|jgi:dihydrofolate synthase/folylpolyglutamate synthase|nr:folylpolyglutamate synthase/dihydrofolate synthase family protein [Planctomycetaceae bacterium]